MDKRSISVLLVEDCDLDARLVTRFLGKCPYCTFTTTHVHSMDQAIEALQQPGFDVVLSDLGLPDSSGLATVQAIVQHAQQIPVIALTGNTDPATGVNAIRHGASDFIPKQELTEHLIARLIQYTIERFRITSELVEANSELESQNRNLQKLYSMSQQFVDNISHEFRTPLTVIREFASIVRDGIDGPVNQSQVTRLNTLINRADDLARMVDDLLDTSRLESGMVKVCRKGWPVDRILKQVRDSLVERAKTRRIELLFPEPSNVRIYGDDEKIRRILFNLIINAIKFAPVGGRIEVGIHKDEKHRIRISVSDNGPGIAPDDLQIIFERFQQVQAHHRMASCKGFGLGLSIARMLAYLNLGELKVDSTEGRGSVFSISLPKDEADAIIQCYMEQRLEESEEHRELSLITLQPDNLSSRRRQEVCETIDDFIRSSVRTRDLVLRHGDTWQLYVCCSASGIQWLLDRLERDWSMLQRNHFRSKLPSLKAESQRTILLDGPVKSLALVPGPKGLVEVFRQKESDQSRTENHPLILIVEDEQDVANALKLRLNSKGYRISLAQDGKAGLEQATEMLPAAILLDIRMPEMDGLQCLENLKANPNTATIPVVVLSASLHDQQQAIDRGADYFLRKPYLATDITSVLDSLLKKSGESQSNGHQLEVTTQ